MPGTSDMRNKRRQMAMNADAARKAQAADRALNQAYTAVMSKASPATRQLLRTSQRHWIAFRDAECALAYAEFGAGSMRVLSSAGCQLQMTAERAIALKFMFAEM